jgi:D-tyrosyl-tRNA(Tyr) deacylase
MSDNLRDRIAVALFAELDSDRQHWSGHISTDILAEAVIEALQLREETVAFANGPLNGFKGGPYDGCKNGANHRYVTEWTTDV